MRVAAEGPVLACVDGSDYSASVCDHAAWLAERYGSAIEVLHLDEGASGPARTRGASAFEGARQVAHTAAERVTEAGAEVADVLHGQGSFGQVAGSMSLRAGVMVLGQQGEGSASSSHLLGENARRLCASAASAVCLAAPRLDSVSRVLILFNAAFPDEALSDFVAASPILDGLDCHVVGYGAARSTRAAAGSTAAVAAHPDAVIRDHLRRADFELLVLPRSALVVDSRRRDLEGLINALQVPVVLPPRGRLRTVLF